MAEFDDLLKQARALGDQILKQSRVHAFFDAVKKIEGDAAARGLLGEYQQKMEELHQKQIDGKPIEVADKRTVSELESRVAGNDIIKEYMRTQADYVELMDKINRAMQEPLAAAAGQLGAHP